jgi:hypothetical protein
LMWFLFWVYVPVGVFVKILMIIVEAMNKSEVKDYGKNN